VKRWDKKLDRARGLALRLAAEFAYVKTDEADAMKQALARAEWIARAPARIFLGRRGETLEGCGSVEEARSHTALTIEFGDDSTKTKRIVVVPGEPINFGYASKEDEAASEDLVMRCARVLDCDVETL
jgi:hypothetical protein